MTWWRDRWTAFCQFWYDVATENEGAAQAAFWRRRIEKSGRWKP